jgi:hypothetical protein
LCHGSSKAEGISVCAALREFVRISVGSKEMNIGGALEEIFVLDEKKTTKKQRKVALYGTFWVFLFC